VDAGAAKELMAYLVKLQSSLSEVNQYVNFSTLTIEKKELLCDVSHDIDNPFYKKNFRP